MRCCWRASGSCFAVVEPAAHIPQLSHAVGELALALCCCELAACALLLRASAWLVL